MSSALTVARGVRTSALVANRQTTAIANVAIARAERIQASLSITSTAMSGESLPYHPAEQRLFPRGALNFCEGFGEWDAFGAGDDAVLRVGTIFDAAISHRGLQTLFGMHRAGGMHVEKPHLTENRGAHEFAVLVDLRADLEAAAARDAVRKRIRLFLLFR